MRGFRSKKAAVIVMALLGLAAAVAAGVAIAASVVVTDTNTVRLRIIQSEFADGFDSGWHTHPGPVFVQVQKGHFTIYQENCGGKSVGPGQTFIEIPLVPVRALAHGEIKWTTSQILPNLVGDATQTPAADPCTHS